MFKLDYWFLFLSHCFISLCNGQTGKLFDPPHRGSMWRYGYNKTVQNKDDNQLRCGGLFSLRNENGRCGVCGDRFGDKQHHDFGGKYASGILSKQYPAGTASIETSIKMDSSHFGYFEFRLCVQNESKKATEDCFNQHHLKINGGSIPSDRKRYNTGKQEAREYRLTVEIPTGIVCSHCVLQWQYVSIDEYGTDEDGWSCHGCGVQRKMRNCADISIGLPETSNVVSNLFTTSVQMSLHNTTVSSAGTSRHLISSQNVSKHVTTTLNPVTKTARKQWWISHNRQKRETFLFSKLLNTFRQMFSSRSNYSGNARKKLSDVNGNSENVHKGLKVRKRREKVFSKDQEKLISDKHRLQTVLSSLFEKLTKKLDKKSDFTQGHFTYGTNMVQNQGPNVDNVNVSSFNTDLGRLFNSTNIKTHGIGYSREIKAQQSDSSESTENTIDLQERENKNIGKNYKLSSHKNDANKETIESIKTYNFGSKVLSPKPVKHVLTNTTVFDPRMPQSDAIYQEGTHKEVHIITETLNVIDSTTRNNFDSTSSPIIPDVYSSNRNATENGNISDLKIQSAGYKIGLRGEKETNEYNMTGENNSQDEFYVSMQKASDYYSIKKDNQTILSILSDYKDAKTDVAIISKRQMTTHSKENTTASKTASFLFVEEPLEEIQTLSNLSESTDKLSVDIGMYGLPNPDLQPLKAPIFIKSGGDIFSQDSHSKLDKTRSNANKDTDDMNKINLAREDSLQIITSAPYISKSQSHKTKRRPTIIFSSVKNHSTVPPGIPMPRLLQDKKFSWLRPHYFLPWTGKHMHSSDLVNIKLTEFADIKKKRPLIFKDRLDQNNEHNFTALKNLISNEDPIVKMQRVDSKLEYKTLYKDNLEDGNVYFYDISVSPTRKIYLHTPTTSPDTQRNNLLGFLSTGIKISSSQASQRNGPKTSEDSQLSCIHCLTSNNGRNNSAAEPKPIPFSKFNSSKMHMHPKQIVQTQSDEAQYVRSKKIPSPRIKVNRLKSPRERRKNDELIDDTIEKIISSPFRTKDNSNVKTSRVIWPKLFDKSTTGYLIQTSQLLSNFDNKIKEIRVTNKSEIQTLPIIGKNENKRKEHILPQTFLHTLETKVPGLSVSRVETNGMPPLFIHRKIMPSFDNSFTTPVKQFTQHTVDPRMGTTSPLFVYVKNIPSLLITKRRILVEKG